ncbi:isoquinoline 1-oxidoreductase beta subunit [Sphingomonas kaistensis]|uniref:Isoquinoline 1-oxidoreductase beta subunit n=1 Tax=Sphingomonas kaistensis TaxID=298708 RepID=A0A7X5Y4I6_9SPHN|nr:molybdopterin cofactor-binding domain-containing protein [Sphingomonas kaistensis]NJC05052.1 isoquinoline 1-oxidoreductase beta subunit [Sphingomonas kaistensis]
MKVSRRTLLVGTGAAAGLAVAWSLWPRSEPASLAATDEALALGPGVLIGRDGRLTVAVPQVETGQGIWTGLAQIAADELGAAWETVGVAPARSGSRWDNDLAGEQGWLAGARPWPGAPDPGLLRITAGATSIRALERPMRQAAAAARTLLIAEAASRWGVRAAECDTGGGFVRHEGKSLPFAALVEGAAARSLPGGDIPLRETPGELAGKPLSRLDAQPKAEGRLRFAGDVRLPGLLHASVRGAGRGSVSLDSPPPSGIRFESGTGWVAALADDWWSADRALAAARVRVLGPAGGDDAAVASALDLALAGDDYQQLHVLGDIEEVFAGVRPLAATYTAAAQLHADLEPPGATARLNDGLLELWAATQAPEVARRAGAEAAGVPLAQTLLYPMPVGGQGGAALEAGMVPVAAALARRTGRPVQVTASRTEQVRGGAVRSPLKARLFARPMPDGSIAGWRMRLAGGDGTAHAFARLLRTGSGGPRPSALAPLPYGIPNVALEFAPADLPLRLGYHRGELHPAVTFFTESFLDELARIGGRDPLSQRMTLLAANPRLARCLVRATALGGWDGGGPGSQMGLCAFSGYGSHIAVVGQAQVGTGGEVQVSRLVAAVDCGRVVNPALVKAEVEGGMLAAIAQATAAAPSFRHARVLGPLEPLLPTLAAAPEILVEVLASDAAPGGASGLGSAAAPAAVGNALAAATGRRLRSLPFDPMS